MAWRTSGSWECSLTSPAVPCTSPFPPVSSRFPWDAANVTANAKSRCFVVAVRACAVGELDHSWIATLCSSLPRACIASRDPYCGWVKESGLCTQLVLGSKWVRALAGRAMKLWQWCQAVLGKAIWNVRLSEREKCRKCLFLTDLHAPPKCLTNFFNVNSQLTGNCWKRKKKKMKELY